MKQLDNLSHDNLICLFAYCLFLFQFQYYTFFLFRSSLLSKCRLNAKKKLNPLSFVLILYMWSNSLFDNSIRCLPENKNLVTFRFGSVLIFTIIFFSYRYWATLYLWSFLFILLYIMIFCNCCHSQNCLPRKQEQH